MADVPREPRIPPIDTPVIDVKTGKMTPAWYRYLAGERSNTNNVNSGVSRAEAAAAVAQATANAAAQATADVAAATLPFSLSQDAFSASGFRLGVGSVTTSSVTVTPVGGTGPYIYAWAYVSGDNSLSATDPTSITTAWTGDVTSPGQDKQATWRCTATDSLLATASVTVGVGIAELT